MFFYDTAESNLASIRYWVDSYAGDSGAPVYDEDGYLIGIHSIGSFGSDPAGAVALIPLVDGSVSVPGAEFFSQLGLFDTRINVGANTTLFGSFAVSAAARTYTTYISMEVDGAIVPEPVQADYPDGWWPAATGGLSFFIPNRLRDGAAHTYRVVAADPLVSTLGPNVPSESNLITVTHNLPTGSFIYNASTRVFVLQYGDPDSSFVHKTPRSALRICPGLSRQCDTIWLNPTAAGASYLNANTTFRYEALVPTSFWIGGPQTLSAQVLDNEDGASIPPAAPIVLPGSVSFNVGYPTGSVPNVTYRCPGGLISASGSARAIQPGYFQVWVGLYVGGILRQIVATNEKQYALTYSVPWAGVQSVSVQAFNPLRPLPAVGSDIGTLKNPTYAAVLFSQSQVYCQ